MSAETLTRSDNLTPPADFKFNPDILEDYDEQVQWAIARENYQAKPLPSFEAVPTIDIAPTFNPTEAVAEEIYAHDQVSEKFRAIGKKPRSEWADSNEPVKMWRILERSKLEDGTGLVSSRILQHNSLGDIERFNPVKHLSSVDERRMSDEEFTTPFVSFATDPENLAKQIRAGFGMREGSDPVIVQASVEPGRVITGKSPKEPEVFLLGGLAPDEYMGAYTVEDFLNTVDANERANSAGAPIEQRNRMLGHDALITA